MESQPVSIPTSPSTIDLEELTAYQHLTSFNLFLYSQNTPNTPLFLLYKHQSSPTFTHCSGNYTKVDPNMFFSVAREFITQNRGLLYSKNLEHFRAERNSHFENDDIVLVEDLTGIVRPQKGFTPPIDDICWLLRDCGYVFQDNKGNVSYFIEIPLLSMEALREAIQKKGLKFEMRYYTLEEIMDSANKNEICEKLRDSFSDKKLLDYTKKFIVNREPIEIREHYAIISCEPVVKTSIFHTLHYSVHRKHGEHWKLYKAFEGELPTDEELKKIRGIIVPGSSCHAYDTEIPWFKDLFECLKKIIHEHKHINFLGICFGAQVVAQALGGKVEKMRRDYKRGEDVLDIKPTFFELEYIKKSGLDRTRPFAIGEAHGDHIVELPAGAVLQAISMTTQVEVYTLGNNVLAWQGHPEYTEAWIAGTHYRKSNIEAEDYDKYAEEYIRETFPVPILREELTKICYMFLKKNTEKGNNK